MTLYNLIDYDVDDEGAIGVFESKLTKNQIKKIVKMVGIIYSEINDYKTSIFEKLIKKGSFELDVSEMNQISFSDSWNWDKKVYRDSSNKTKFIIKSPYKDKTFKWIKVKEIDF